MITLIFNKPYDTFYRKTQQYSKATQTHTRRKCLSTKSKINPSIIERITTTGASRGRNYKSRIRKTHKLRNQFRSIVMETELQI